MKQRGVSQTVVAVMVPTVWYDTSYVSNDKTERQHDDVVWQVAYGDNAKQEAQQTRRGIVTNHHFSCYISSKWLHHNMCSTR